MSSLTTEFEAANLRVNQFFLNLFLQWYLLTVSVETSDRHHKRTLKNQNRAHQQQRAQERKLRKQQAAPRPGW